MNPEVSTRWLLPLLGCGLALRAQADPATALMEYMYGKFTASFSSIQAHEEFLLLARPGIPIGPAQTRDAYEISLLLDQVPKPFWIYTPSSDTYSSLFRRVLRFAQATSYQDQALREKALEAKQYLFDRRRPGQPSWQYQSYLTWKAAYGQAEDALSIARADRRTTGKPVPVALEAKLTQALRGWQSQGFKAPCEAAIAALDASYDGNTQAAFFQLGRQLEAATHQDFRLNAWLPVTTDPPLRDWLAPTGWHTWSFNRADHVPPDRRSLNAMRGHTSLPPAWIPPSTLQSLAMTAEVKRIAVARPWMPSSVFKSHAWRLPQTAGLTLLSSGDPSDPEPGRMPLLVTGVLLARDLKMAVTVPAQGLAKLPGSLGPFALADPAMARQTVLRTSVTRYQDIQSIQVDGAQIIGFFCQRVPRSPAPDPKYFR